MNNITPAQWEILEVLWDEPNITAKYLVYEINLRRKIQISHGTIYAQLHKMIKKDLVQEIDEGKKYDSRLYVRHLLYKANINKEDALKLMLKQAKQQYKCLFKNKIIVDNTL